MLLYIFSGITFLFTVIVIYLYLTSELPNLFED